MEQNIAQAGVQTSQGSQANSQAGSQANEAQASQHDSASVVLTQGLGGILGIKAGMTQVYNDEGLVQSVTVIDLKPVVITQIKTLQKEGYQAIQVGFIEKNPKRAKKSELGHTKKLGNKAFYHYQEIRFPKDAKLEGLSIGQVLSPDFIKSGDLVDLSARSKGKGFQGGMKRFHMSGGMKTHGASLSHRSLGSIGNRADPGKCFKNKKMPGHMGHEKVTIQNIKVVKVDAENKLLLVNGSVPGPKSGIVMIKKAIKHVQKGN